MLNTDGLLMIAAGLLLLAVNWLAFHDFREAHTVRDWLCYLHPPWYSSSSQESSGSETSDTVESVTLPNMVLQPTSGSRLSFTVGPLQ